MGMEDGDGDGNEVGDGNEDNGDGDGNEDGDGNWRLEIGDGNCQANGIVVMVKSLVMVMEMTMAMDNVKDE